MKLGRQSQYYNSGAKYSPPYKPQKQDSAHKRTLKIQKRQQAKVWAKQAKSEKQFRANLLNLQRTAGTELTCLMLIGLAFR